GCPNQYGSDPNTNVCPVCLGMPGSLPVPNEEALKQTALAGMLLNCDIPARAKFDRKNYFYPDAAKDYQISQFALPSNVGGYVEFEFEGGIKRVNLDRAHLEEDVGKSTHFDKHSGVDFNRGGVPLLEIVTEAEITSADMAYAYLNALKDILVYGGVSDCDMEKGMVRCDVNISVRPKGQTELGSKIEIKNMNTFSGARKALEHEIERQVEVVSNGGTIPQSTRRWDDVAEITEEMRSKENAHDYRYFPCPDLMPLEPQEDWLADVRTRVVELPLARKQRFVQDYGIPVGDAETFKNDVALGNYFEGVAKESKNPKGIANFVINNLRAKLAEAEIGLDELKFEPTGIAELIELIDSGKISSQNAQDAFAEMFANGGSPKKIVEDKGLIQESDEGQLDAWCEAAIAANPGPAEDVRNGKDAAVNRIMGHVMKLSGKKANPGAVVKMLKQKLSP
ncbi:MAG: aspartyl-tRNA(Asn)/glutamyl-tRNA(Gln) amidotransferase subunit B, partial [Limisphaerales bacterium]